MTSEDDAEGDELRRRLEERFRTKSSAHETPRTTYETARLIQDLEIHQIELEMQNDELSKTKARLDEQIARYTDLYDFAPVGYFSLDARGVILRTNLCGARLLGMERDRLTGTFFGAFLSPNDLPIFMAFLQNAFTQEAAHTCTLGIASHPNATVELHAALSDETHECLVTAFDVTERTHSEVAIRNSEQRLKLALQGSVAIAFEWNKETDRVTRYFSTEPALPVNVNHPETIGDVRSRVHPDDLAVFDAGVKACLDQGPEYRNLYRVIRPDSSIRWLEEWGNLTRNDDGTPRKLSGFSMDVTRRMHDEAEKRKTDELLKAVIEGTTDAVFVKDGDGKYVLINQSAARFVGKPASQILGHNDQAIFDEAGAQRAMEVDRRILREGVARTEVYSLTTGGVTRLFESTKAPYRDENGNMIGVIGVARDVTERERSTKILNSLLGSLDDAIVCTDENGTIQMANNSIEDVFGYSIDEVIDQNFKMLFSDPYRNELEAYLVNYLTTGVSKIIGKSLEMKGQRKDGSAVPIDLTITEFRLNGKRHFTGVARDITNRKQLESQFIQAQKMDAVGRLAGGVAHDFNNLLTIILGYGHSILADSPADFPHRESIAAIVDAGTRAAVLTQQLLALSRKPLFEPKSVDLNHIVEETTSMLRRLVGEDIRLTIACDPTLPRICAAPQQVEQIIMNLVVNARDAMPDGGRIVIKTRQITLSESSQTKYAGLPWGNYVQMTIADTGHGIPDAIKDQIFEPFFTTKAVGKGTGLGLSVVHGCVKQCGGTVLFESQINVGTTFEILFPVAAQTIKVAESTPIDLSTEGSETILLVEDERAVRTIVRLGLEKSGYRVLEADGAKQAMRIAETHPHAIHLLLTDVVMPDVTGPKLADAVKKLRPAIRVVFMSGYAADEIVTRGLSNATENVLQKPFTSAALKHIVREMLDRRPLDAEAPPTSGGSEPV